MAADNLYQELKDILQDFKTFLDDNVPTIKPAIQQLAGLISQITDLIDALIDLMVGLKEEITKLDVGAIPGLETASTFTGKVKSFAETVKNLLPEQEGAINTVLSVVDVVSGLPSLDEVKADILELIGAESPPSGILGHLVSLKPTT